MVRKSLNIYVYCILSIDFNFKIRYFILVAYLVFHDIKFQKFDILYKISGTRNLEMLRTVMHTQALNMIALKPSPFSSQMNKDVS